MNQDMGSKTIAVVISQHQYEILIEALSMYIADEDQLGTAWYYPTKDLISQVEELWTNKKNLQ
jgi:hypothetical protein